MTKDEISLAAVGQALIQRDLRGHAEPALREIGTILKAADIAFTNLETTIAGPFGGWPTKVGLTTAAPPAVLDTLTQLGFNSLALSNNHAWDFGPNGVLSTMEAVEQRGFLHAGVGRDLTSAARGGMREIGGRRVALLAMDAGPGPEAALARDATATSPARPGLNHQLVTPAVTIDPELMARLRALKDAVGHEREMPRYRRLTPENSRGSFQHVPQVGADELYFYGLRFRLGDSAVREGMLDQADLARNLAAIERAKASADFVIVYLHHHHWQPRWEEVPAWTRDFARSCIEAGADIYLSHGVPMVQGIEIHRDRPIFYSLGNFIFHVPGDPSAWVHQDVWRSVVATSRFRHGRLTEIELAPVVVGGEAALAAGDYSNREVPMLASASQAEDIIARIAERSAPFGTRVTFEDGCGRVRL